MIDEPAHLRALLESEYPGDGDALCDFLVGEGLPYMGKNPETEGPIAGNEDGTDIWQGERMNGRWQLFRVR